MNWERALVRVGFHYSMELNFTSEDAKQSFWLRTENTKWRLTPRGSPPLGSHKLSRKNNLSGNHLCSIYIYPEQPHPSSTHSKKILKNDDNWPNEEKEGKKFHPGFEPRTSGTPGEELDPYNCTIMHMVSGHHRNMFSSISPNQRHQSNSTNTKLLNFHTLHAHIKISHLSGP